MPPRPRLRNTADTLAAVAPLVTRFMERVLADHDPPLTLGQYLGLRAIAAGTESAAELARAAGVSEAAVSQLMAAFERAGTVERTAAGDDRRRRRPALTAEGERVLRSAQTLVRQSARPPARIARPARRRGAGGGARAARADPGGPAPAAASTAAASARASSSPSAAAAAVTSRR